MKRLPLPLLAAAAAAVGLAAGCTRDPGEVVRFMIWGSPDEIQVVQGYLTEFRRVHPEIAVQVEHAPSMGYSQKLSTLVRGGNVPDVLYVNEGDVPWLVQQRALLDLAPLAKRDAAEVELDDLYPLAQSPFQRGAATYGVCKDFTTLVLYYNRDLFDAWDVPYPKAGWTWDDFRAKAEKLTRRDRGQWGFLLETWPEELYPWIWQPGATIAQDDPPRWLMGTPEQVDAAAEGLQFLADLIWHDDPAKRVTPSPSMTRDQAGNALFLRGQAAMCTYGRWACMDFKNISAFDWDAVELPRHRDGGRATTTFSVAYSVGAATALPEQSWTLVKFLTSKAAQAAVGHSGQAIPSRRSVAESDAFLRPQALLERGISIDSRPFVEQVAVGRLKPMFLTAPEAKFAFQTGIEPLWNGTRRDARALLLELQPRIEALVATDPALKRP